MISAVDTKSAKHQHVVLRTFVFLLISDCYCHMLVFSVDSTASSMSSGRLQKKSIPVLLSSSSMVIMQLGKVIELHELLICSVQ